MFSLAVSYCKVLLTLRECFLSFFLNSLELFYIAIDANSILKKNLIAIKKKVPTVMFFFLPLV